MMNKIYTVEQISDMLAPVFARHGVRHAVLFGPYAKNTARRQSDIDLLVDSELRGLQFVGLIKDIRETMNKDVDIFDVSHVDTGSRIGEEISSTGVTIYEK